MEVHHRHFVELRVLLVQVETLRLADIWTSGDSQIHHFLLADFPDCLVNLFNLSWDFLDSLHAAIVSNNLVFDRSVPEVELDQISYEVLVDADEFSRENSSRVDI